jgi:hypothetical protein
MVNIAELLKPKIGKIPKQLFHSSKKKAALADGLSFGSAFIKKQK